MSDTEALLNSLKDIQEPLAPASTSIGLIAANLCLVLLIVLVLYLRWKRRKEGWRREALQIVMQARKLDAQPGTLKLAKALRQLIRHRVDDGHELHGDAWLAKLDQHFSTDWFSTDQGRIFGSELYRNNSLQPDAYLSLCDTNAKLIKKLPNRSNQNLSAQ